MRGANSSWHVLIQEDVGALYASRDPEEYGRARLSHVADTWKGKLDPAEYLNPGRHGEWTSASGPYPANNPGALHLGCIVMPAKLC